MEAEKVLISLYPNVHDTTDKDFPLWAFLDGIKNGTWQDIVLRVRNIADKKQRAAEKQLCPAVTISASMKGRKDTDVRKHSGFIAIDLDDIENANTVKDLIAGDPYIFSAFLSISGYGLCLLFRINGDRHLDSFEGIAKYLYDTYQLIVDQSGKNVSRLRFVSYDPYLILNESAQVFKKYIPKDKPKKIQKVVVVKSDFDSIVKQLYDRGINLCEGYKEWVATAYSLISQFGEQGREYFHTLSAVSGKYDTLDTDKQFDSCLRNSNSASAKDRVATIGSIYFFAKQNGIEIYSAQTKEIIRAASSQKRSGVAAPGIEKSLEQFAGIPAEESRGIINQVIANNIKHHSDSIVDDLITLLKPYQLRKNLISRNVELRGKPIDDSDINSIYLDAKIAFEEVSKDLVCSLLFSNRIEAYNPIHEFFSQHEPVEDLCPNLTALINSIDTDTVNHDKWITKWLVSAVASAYGYHSPLILVLCGAIQGTGKCLGKNTPVIMADGSIKSVQDIKIDDLLMGPDGSSRKVTSIAIGREQMYWVRQNKGIDYRVNQSHILSLKDRDTHVTKNISVGDFLNKKGRKSRMVGYRGIIKNDVDSTLSVDPYFLGLWLGDGMSDLSQGVRIESADQEIIDFLTYYANSLGQFISKYEQKKSNSDCFAIVSVKGSGVSVKQKDPTKLKFKMMALGLSNNKHIPLIYRMASKYQRLQVLAGLIDSDGSVAGASNYEITQKCKELADHICFLSRSIGFRATMNEKIINGDSYWRIHIGGDVCDIPVKVNRKRITQKGFYNVLYTGITVEKDIVDDYYGFELSGPDRLFMLGDFTVTHNTYWLRHLLPKSLMSLFAESKMDAGKDDEILMTKKWIILDDEYDGKSKKEEKKIKAITSKAWINVREPYGRVSMDLRRLSVFCGTSNETQILNDPTGNRRIIPINVTAINQSLYNQCDKDQLWVELYSLYKAGYDYTILKDDIPILNANTEDFKQSSPEEELIHDKITPGGSQSGEWMTTTSIIEYLILNTKRNGLSNTKIGILLTSRGFEKKRVYKDRNTVTVYLVRKLETTGTPTPLPFP